MAKVFIYTQAYNAEKTVSRAVESILSQSFTDWEYHIVNNGSNDGTNDALTHYSIDSRIKVIQNTPNDITFWLRYLPMALVETEAEWFCWLDADDEYLFDFVEKMFTFVIDNKLDMAACGYTKLNGITGEKIKERVSRVSFTISGSDFTERFIDYRGFTLSMWAKFISKDLFYTVLKNFINPEFMNCNDGVFMLNIFWRSEHAGIYSESLINYYQYPKSGFHEYFEKEIEKGHIVLWEATRDYLAAYGDISQLNQDFLYAIFLSIIEDVFKELKEMDMEISLKLQHLEQIFSNPHTKAMLKCKADPQFRNLTLRSKFLQNVREWVCTQVDEVPTILFSLLSV